MKLRTVASMAGAFALGVGSMALVGTPAEAAKTPASEKGVLHRSLGLFGDALDTVLKHHLRTIDGAKAVEAATAGMMKSLDPHSDYIAPQTFEDMRNPSARPAGVGLDLTVDLIGVRVAREVVPRDEVQVGDYLLAVDGRATRGALDETRDRLRGPDGSSVSLALMREGRITTVTVPRRILDPMTGLTSRMIGDVGYVAIRTFHENATRDLEAAIGGLRSANPGMKALVLDLRGSTGGLFEECVGIADLFIEDGLIVAQRGREPNDVERYGARAGDVLQGLPLVVLVDDVTASGAEIVAGALQDRGRARLVGMPTWGAGTIQTVIPIRGGQSGALKLTTSEVRLPSGRSFHKTGLAPDLLVAGDAAVSTIPPSGESALSAEAGATPSAQHKPETPPKGFDPKGDYQLARAVELAKS